MRDVVDFKDRLELRLGELSGQDDVMAEGAIDFARLQEIDAISAALDRIKDGRFGRCLICGSDVSKSRLSSNPTAALCTNCARS